MKPRILWSLALLSSLLSAKFAHAQTAALSPQALAFGPQKVGTTSAAKAVTLSNAGAAPLSITSLVIAGANAADFAQTNTCGSSVAAGTSCTISATFTPSASGARTASITVTDNASGNAQAVGLSGTGTAPSVSLSPTSVSFGNQSSGTTSGAQTVTVNNSGNGDLSISKVEITGANSSDFAQTNTCGTSVAAGVNCTVSITFTPSASGSRSASVVITDDAAGSPQTVSLSGGPPAAPSSAEASAATVAGPPHYWLGMAGLDLTSTSNGPQQEWFAEAALMEQLRAGKKPFGGIWGWLDAKIGSIPTLKTSAVSSVTGLSTAVSTATSSTGVQNVGDIAQSLEFHTGLAFSLFKAARLAAITGFGAASPINPISGAQEYSLSQTLYNQFVSNTSLESAYPQLWAALACYAPSKPSGCASPPTISTVAFVLPTRNRFLRDYFLGLRFWSPPRGGGNNFPGLFDVTFGQDETVTGGRLRGVVLGLSGNYPVDSKGEFRVFASVHMRFARNTSSMALDMIPLTTPVATTDSSVVIQQTTPLDRDYFRVGVGVDISQVLNALTKKGSETSPSQAPAAASGGGTAPASDEKKGKGST